MKFLQSLTSTIRICSRPLSPRPPLPLSAPLPPLPPPPLVTKAHNAEMMSRRVTCVQTKQAQREVVSAEASKQAVSLCSLLVVRETDVITRVRVWSAEWVCR